MFDWLKRLFGEGKVRVEFETISGRTGTAKSPFIGSFDSEKELINSIGSALSVEIGPIKRLRVVAVTGFNTGGDVKITGAWFEVKPEHLQ